MNEFATTEVREKNKKNTCCTYWHFCICTSPAKFDQWNEFKKSNAQEWKNIKEYESIDTVGSYDVFNTHTHTHTHTHNVYAKTKPARSSIDSSCLCFLPDMRGDRALAGENGLALSVSLGNDNFGW